MFLKTLQPKWMILKVDFALNHSNYTSLNRVICLKSILKDFSEILHFQFNYHTLPVTPFKFYKTYVNPDLNILKMYFLTLYLFYEGENVMFVLTG